MINRFDPITGLPVKTAPPAVNTRTMLYHSTREAIVVEGKGDTDAAKRADVAAQIQAKMKQGYTLNRPHGQHPHSNDDHRLEHQMRLAADKDADGHKEAKAALVAKGAIPAEPKEAKA